MIEQMLLIAKANNIDNLNEDEITNIKHGIAQTFYELIEENKKIPQNRMKEILLTLTKIIAKEQGLNVSVGFRATSAVEMENKSSIPLASHISGEDGEDSKILFSTIYGGFSGIKTYEYLLNDCEDNFFNTAVARLSTNIWYSSVAPTISTLSPVAGDVFIGNAFIF